MQQGYLMTDMTPARSSSRALFIATILTGSFLLFLVQPMVARMALPKLGGAPAVWNSAMLVYQALLLAGYAYAHWLSKQPSRRQALIHIPLFAIAAIWLPIGLANFEIPADGSPIFWVPALLAASIGPLFLAVAAQAPLMQRWYSLAGNQGEPYALYAASNIGSFAGLIAYPLLVEPLLPLAQQTALWSGLYLLLLALIAVCAWKMWSAKPLAEAELVQTAPASPAITWQTRLYWMALSAVPSGLMLSTTSHLTTDLMAMPLIWVIPLGLYLLSFSVAFADIRTLANRITQIAPVLLLLAAAVAMMVWGKAVAYGLVASATMLFVVSVALHGEMYRTRPAPDRLTEFYLIMSFGGMLGGLFCAIAAPLIFDWPWEHPVLILAAALLLPQARLFAIRDDGVLRGKSLLLLGLLLVGLVIIMGVKDNIALDRELNMQKAVLTVAGLFLCLVLIGERLSYTLGVLALLIANGGWYNAMLSASDTRWRSYFGTYTVNGGADSGMRWLSHGTTLHGIQISATPTTPVSYYGPNSGVGLAFSRADELYGKGAALGVVGLGTGTLACYAKPGQPWHFYEIDPLVATIARDKGLFTYLKSCTPDAKIHIGDARLTLAAQPKGTFSMLAIDAFSSDSVPLHLLTKEAFEVYRRALKPDGLLLVHISNRHIDLNTVVAAEAKGGKWASAIRHDNPPLDDVSRGMRGSYWVAFSADEGKLAQLTGLVADKETKGVYRPKEWTKLFDPGKTTRWSDDYASVLPHLSLWENRQ
jgi:SAM-dependent methyltransferase